MSKLTYQTKANRDAKYKELKVLGFKVKKYSSRGQLCHPQYIEDYTEIDKFNTGIGNTLYKTLFNCLYMLTW